MYLLASLSPFTLSEKKQTYPVGTLERMHRVYSLSSNWLPSSIKGQTDCKEPKLPSARLWHTSHLDRLFVTTSMGRACQYRLSVILW